MAPALFKRGIAATALLLRLAAAYITEDGTVVIPGAASYNGLNLVPQMGWDNWNAFGCDVDEELLLGTARAMVNYGLRDLGYNYGEARSEPLPRPAN